MKFIVPIPDHKYYLWQVLVQIANFRQMGYEQDMHIPVVYFGEPSETLKKLADSKELECHWHIYADDRTDKSYSASMKPYLMSLFFRDFPELGKEVFCYLDPDCIFTKPMNFEPFIGDDIWYGSDTRSYTGVKYIKDKGEQLFYEMCAICGVDAATIEANDEHSCIGAQYFIKNSTEELWKEIEESSVPLYKHMRDTADKYHPEGQQFPIQAWTSEMWTTIYIPQKRGITLRTSPLMDFHWANHNSKDWFKKPFFHNAGQTTENGRDFCKISHQSSPFSKEIVVSPDSASWYYLQLIKLTEIIFPDLIWK